MSYKMAVRISAVTSVRDQHAVVLASLETYASRVADEAAAKACCLLNQLRQGKALSALGLKVAVLV